MRNHLIGPPLRIYGTPFCLHSSLVLEELHLMSIPLLVLIQFRSGKDRNQAVETYGFQKSTRKPVQQKRALLSARKTLSQKIRWSVLKKESALTSGLHSTHWHTHVHTYK